MLNVEHLAIHLLLAMLYVSTPASAQSMQAESWQWDTTFEYARPFDSQHRTDANDEWLAEDKLVHAYASMMLTLSAQYLLVERAGVSEEDALPIAASSALTAGIIKEVMDSQQSENPHFSFRDLVADGAGILLAIGLLAL